MKQMRSTNRIDEYDFGAGFARRQLPGNDLPDASFTLKTRPLVFAGSHRDPSYSLLIRVLLVMCMGVALVAIAL